MKLDDIGHMAGVSRSTVSRVVNGEPNVRPEVRSRVQEVIRKTGYTPHVAARSLVSNRTGVIGLVIPSRVHRLFEDPYFARLIQGITLASNQAGTILSLFLFQTEVEEQSLSPRVIESGFLDGVIITATRMEDPLLDRIAASRLPLVMVGRPDRDDLSYVDVDNCEGGVIAARHLYGIGRRRIGVIGAPTNTTTGHDRLAGFLDGLAEHGLALDPDRRVDGDYSEAGGYDAMQHLLDRDVDAVFAASDQMAFGAIRALRERGLDVPGDVAVVGFDGFTAAEQHVPTLTTIRQSVGDTAARAVELLTGLVSGTVETPTSAVLPVELIVGGTTIAEVER